MTKETYATKILVPSALKEIFLTKALKSSHGRWVTLEYRKLDGTSARMNGRLGVHCALKGGKSTSKVGAVVLFVPNRYGYRTVYPSRVQEVHFNHHHFIFTNAPEANETTMGTITRALTA